MASGDVTCTVIGNYNTIALAVAAINGGNLAAATDKYEIIQQQGIGSSRFTVVKTVRAP